MEPDEQRERLREELEARASAAEELLEQLVNQPSGSNDRDGVARVLSQLGCALSDAGLSVELHADGGRPRHLTGTLGGNGAGTASRRIVLIGHCDTVFPTTDDRVLTWDEDRFYGPGCADMKGGLVVMIEALRTMGPRLVDRGFEVEVLVNGDEELGSPDSCTLIRERARGARAALVYENCEDAAGVIVGRRGLGRAKVDIEGCAAHAGINPEDGASAVVEMARQIVDMSALHNPERGMGVVVGLASGGVSRNTVPPSARLEIDLRFDDRQLAEQTLAALAERGNRTTVPGTRARFSGELHRPPMNAETANQRSLFDLAVGVGARLGVSLRGHVTGGGSDANLTADLGVPSLDGLGVVGAEIHTRREWCFRRSLVSKALFSALLLDALSEEPSS